MSALGGELPAGDSAGLRELAVGEASGVGELAGAEEPPWGSPHGRTRRRGACRCGGRRAKNPPPDPPARGTHAGRPGITVCPALPWSCAWRPADTCRRLRDGWREEPVSPPLLTNPTTPWAASGSRNW